MSKLFAKQDIKLIQNGYNRFILEKVKNETYNQYVAIVEEYLRDIVMYKVNYGDYIAIFSDENIKNFRKKRKSNIARAALNHLLKYFISKGLIEKGFEFNFPIIEAPKIKAEFLAIEEIKYIFNGAIFKDKIEELFAKAICSLSAFCFFEQKHIKKLKLTDVDLDSGLIKNLRAVEDEEDSSYLIRWIKLNELAQSYLSSYLDEYRSKLNVEYDEFFIFDGAPIDDINGVNKHILPFKRKANESHLSSVNIQSLCASSMIYWLIATNGRAIFQLSQIVENKNEQLKKAFRYYMLNYSEIENVTGIVDVDEFDIIEAKYRKAEENLTEQPIENDEEYFVDVFKSFLRYSEEADIKEADIVNYDSINENNLDSKEVTINRLVRDTYISKELKKLYQNKCQLCGIQLRSANGDFMSEAHHIKPYNKIHQGDDTFKNLIILCPNCHSQFDQLFYAIDPITKKVNSLFVEDHYHLSKLNMVDGHVLGNEYLEYIWVLFLDKQDKLNS